MAYPDPIITASVKDVNPVTVALTGDENKLIRYYSNAKATMTAEAQGGASIDEDLYVISNGGNTAYGKEHTFERVESNLFSFSAQDSNGNITVEPITPTMVYYIPLTCNMDNNRPDAVGHMRISCSGNYFNSSFGAKSNTLKASYSYRETYDGASWTLSEPMTVTISGNTYSAYAEFDLDEYAQGKYYDFSVYVQDELSAVGDEQYDINSLPIFHWGKEDFVFEKPVIFNGTYDANNCVMFNNGITTKGNVEAYKNLLLGSNGNYGSKIIFGNGLNCYIAENVDNEMTLHASRINLDSSNIYLQGKKLSFNYGEWEPSLNYAAINYYINLDGWYSKLGNTVTVGFNIKAQCKSGYNSTVIYISGLPYTPKYQASGGGICSGAYVPGGYNFQCFVAETNGAISTRVQGCNHTSSENLITSDTACNYPYNGGELTLSGTITYFTNS